MAIRFIGNLDNSMPIKQESVSPAWMRPIPTNAGMRRNQACTLSPNPIPSTINDLRSGPDLTFQRNPLAASNDRFAAIHPIGDTSFQNPAVGYAIIGQIFVGNFHPIVCSTNQGEGAFLREPLKFLHELV